MLEKTIPSVTGTSISATSVSGGLPPSRGHPSRAAFIRLGDIRLGAIRLRDWEGQDEWHRRMSLGRKAMKTEDPSVQAFPPRAIRLRHPSVPPISWMSVSAFRLGAIRLRDWEGQDEWHRRMSLGRKAMKTEDPSVQAFPPRAIRLRHPSVPPVSWISVSDFRLGVIRLGVIRLGVLRLGDSLQVKSRESTFFSPHTALQPTTTHSFIKYSKTAITTKTCQTNLKTIIIPNTLISAHTPYACIIIKYIKRQSMAFSCSSLPHTHTKTQADTPDPNYINATPQSLTRHSVAD